jgi:hypothetical protein
MVPLEKAVKWSLDVEKRIFHCYLFALPHPCNEEDIRAYNELNTTATSQLVTSCTYPLQLLSLSLHFMLVPAFNLQSD